MTCANCFGNENEHVMGRCPKIGTHVVIDAETIERATRTGHPRLLSTVLKGEARSVLTGVEITGLQVLNAAAGEPNA